MEETETVPGATETAPEAPPAGFGDDQTQPVEGQAAESPAAERENWEALYQRIEADEELKKEYDSHLEPFRQEERRKGLSEAQRRLQPMLQTYRDAATASNLGIQEIFKAVQKAAKDGLVDTDTVVEALRSQPQAWDALNGLSHIAGTFDGAKSLIRLMASDNPDLAAQYQARVDGVLVGSDTSEAVAADFMDALISEREKKAEEKGYKRGLKEWKTGMAEEVKATARPGQGPSTAKTTSGGKAVSSMAEADRRYNLPDTDPEHISHAAYKDARQQYGVS